MGVMESAVAVRSEDADEVTDVFLSVMRGLGHRCEARLGPDPKQPYGSSYDVLVAPSRDGWVFLRPHYVVPAEMLAAELTGRLGTLASAISIFEDVLWTHWLVERGATLDRHVNFPEYFGPGEYDDSWIGDPDAVARAVGVDRAQVAPYFRQISARRARTPFLRPIKAHRSDSWNLLNGWVVTELWRRMGIHWPDESSEPMIRVSVGRDGTTALSESMRSS